MSALLRDPTLWLLLALCLGLLACICLLVAHGNRQVSQLFESPPFRTADRDLIEQQSRAIAAAPSTVRRLPRPVSELIDQAEVAEIKRLITPHRHGGHRSRSKPTRTER